MKCAPKLVLVLKIWIVFSFLLVIATATLGHSRPTRKLAASNPGFISIDCGVEEDYIDEGTGISYKSDRDFVDTGTNYEISSNYTIQNPFYGRQTKNLRSFSEGTKNCYTLKPEQGKNNPYLIRAFFQYGNYDNKNQFPTFDVHIGVNFWTTIQIFNASVVHFPEVIHVPSSDTIFVCLIKTDNGVPFISALELRHLDNSSYRIESGGLKLVLRSDMGSSSEMFVRYKDDVYDRLWHTKMSPALISINTPSDIDVQGSKDVYEPPAQVLRTGVVPQSGYSDYNFVYNLESGKYFVYLHFAEIEEHAQSQKREFNIYWNGVNYLKGPITLDYLKAVTVYLQNVPATGDVKLYLNSTIGPELPPILNALEIFSVVPLSLLLTEPEDVAAIMDIKKTYRINIDTWQGDPCVPSNISWNNLTCSSDNIARIISLNLSSSQLKGEIATSLSNLRAIQSLDLSYNELSGPIPNFFAQLPNLKILNLTGNKLTGSIPKALLEKSRNKLIELRLEDNPKLCQTDSCNKQHKKVLILIVAIVAFVSIIIFLGALAFFWRVKKKRQAAFSVSSETLNTPPMVTSRVIVDESKKEGRLKSSNQTFTHSKVVEITRNFENCIGEGGFGKVYSGTLDGSDTQVAVKRWSTSSRQGYKEFQAEAHMKVHHKNLVSLVGYCDEADNKALIYEYMPNGNLRQYLSEESTKILTWGERLKIALDAARGLEYLHSGCREPIVHRDVKTSNILLNEKWEAKLADFGLSRVFATENDTHVSTEPKGTNGYLDPEYNVTKNLNKASDIYSFGVVLLELVTGRPAITEQNSKPVLISQWVNPLYKKRDIGSIVDPRLQEPYNYTASAERVIDIAITCVEIPAAHRPNISEVCDALKESQKLQRDAERSQKKEKEKTSSCGQIKTGGPSAVETGGSREIQMDHLDRNGSRS